MAVVLPVRVDRIESLRYLGHGNGMQVPRAVTELLDGAEAWIKAHLRPQGVRRTLPVCREAGRPGLTRIIAGPDRSSPVLELSSRRLAELFARSEHVTLLAVTLGPQLDRRVDQLSREGRLAEATVLDAAGSAVVECAVEEMCRVVATEAAGGGYQLTSRYSPGYGDLPLDLQPVLLALVGAEGIGITATEAHMLRPQKSVTALAGWDPASGCSSVRSPGKDCDRCTLGQCPYRRVSPDGAATSSN